MSVARIALLGAESTGKSTLAQALAARYGTLWVPEYLREFVDVHARVPREDDQAGIARTQRAREDALARDAHARDYLFCDTTPLMTAVYSRIYWGRRPTCWRWRRPTTTRSRSSRRRTCRGCRTG